MEESKRILLRREGNVLGGVLLIYQGIMNVSFFLVATVVTMIQMTLYFVQNPPTADVFEGLVEMSANTALESANWGYLLAVLLGLILLLLWKKPSFFSQIVFVRQKNMKPRDFTFLAVIFLSAQVLYRLWYILLEYAANLLGFSMESVLQSVSISTDSLPMFLYACLIAPVTEEILFRGLVLRHLEPRGKKYAILLSALLFGLFHGNILQVPFAALTGLVLGYVALEYNICWAMVLHLMNNLLLGDLLPRLLSYLPGGLGDLILVVFLLTCALATLIILILHWRDVREYFKREKIEKGMFTSFLRAPCVIIFLILSIINIVSLPLIAFFAQ